MRSPSLHDSCFCRHAASLAVLRHSTVLAREKMDQRSLQVVTTQSVGAKGLIKKHAIGWHLKDDAPAGCQMAPQSLRHFHIGLRVTVRKLWYPSA